MVNKKLVIIKHRAPAFVVPAQAGTQCVVWYVIALVTQERLVWLDSRLRGNDGGECADCEGYRGTNRVNTNWVGWLDNYKISHYSSSRTRLRRSREGGNPVCGLARYFVSDVERCWIPAFAGMTACSAGIAKGIAGITE